MAEERKEYYPHDRLTHLCNEMVERPEQTEGSEGVKAVIMLNDGERGGIVFHGYDPEQDQADALVDLFIHLKAIFKANGKELMVAPLPGSPGTN